MGASPSDLEIQERFVLELKAVQVAFWACQEVSFPLEQVSVIHPTLGEMTIVVPKAPACMPCLETKEVGFAFMSIEDVVNLLQSSEDFRIIWEEARGNAAAGDAPDFGSQDALKRSVHENRAFISFDGWTFEGFKGKFRISPDAMGLPAVEETHPLTMVPVDVYYTPKEGPLFQLDLAYNESSEWTVNCMPRQLFGDQGQYTHNQLASRMRAQAEMSDILLTQLRFQELLAQARLSQPDVPSGATSPSAALPAARPGLSQWTAALPGRNAALQLQAPRISTAAAGTTGGLLRTSDLSNPSVGSKVATSASNGLVNPKAMTSARLTAKNLSKLESQTSTFGSPFKRPPPVPSLPGSSPPFKVARTVFSSASSGKGDARARPSVISSLAGRLPLANTGLRSALGKASDKGSCAETSVGGTDSELGLTGDKYERAVQRCNAFLALKGINLVAALQNLQKLITFNINNGVDMPQLPVAHKICKTCCDMPWPKLLVIEWSTAKSNAKLILHTEDTSVKVFPAENRLAYCNRYALEFTTPKRTITDAAKFWAAADLLQTREKVAERSLDKPTIWVSSITEDEFDALAPRAFAQMVVDGVMTPLASKGKAGFETLLSFGRFIKLRISDYPQKFQDPLADVIQKIKVLAFLHGKFPFEEDSNAADLEQQLKLKSDKFVVALQADSFHKSKIDLSWALNASEKMQWPNVKKELENFIQAGPGEIESFATKVMKSHALWQKSVRPSTLEAVQDAINRPLNKVIKDLQGKTSIDAEQQGVLKKHLALARSVVATWKSQDLSQCLVDATDFLAKEAAAEAHDTLVAGLANFVKVPDRGLIAIDTLQEALPADAKAVVMMRDAENAESSVAAFEHVVAHLLANFPSTIATALKVAKRLSLNIAFADSIEKSLVDRQADLKGKTAIIYNLVALEVQQRKYMALGETTQGRLEKDPQLVVTKALVRATALALPTSDMAKTTLEAIKDQKALRTLKETAETALKNHGAAYIAQGAPALEQAHENIKGSCGGSTNGESWKAHLTDTSTKEDVFNTAKGTIDLIQSGDFIAKLSALVKEQARNKIRHETFGMERNATEAKAISDTIAAARITLTEHFLMIAVAKAETDLAKGKDLVNAQIKSWGAVDITFDQILPKLWHYCQQVCSGQKPSD